MSHKHGFSWSGSHGHSLLIANSQGNTNLTASNAAAITGGAQASFYPGTTNGGGWYSKYVSGTSISISKDTGEASSTNTGYDGSSTDTEARPDNYTYRIWKRTN